jgi:hypothetical protein
MSACVGSVIRWTIVGCLLAPAAGCSSASIQPAQTNPKIKAVTILLSGSPNATTQGDSCGHGGVLVSRIMANARLALARAGFQVVTNSNIPYQARAVVYGDYGGCDTNYTRGGKWSIALEPGPAATWACESDTGWCRFEQGSNEFDPVATKLVKDPGIAELAKRGFVQRPAAHAKAAENSAPGTAKVSSAPASKPATRSLETGSPQRNAWALVIGVERYRDVSAVATGARADAEAYAELARTTLGIPNDQVLVAIDEHASRSDLNKLVEQTVKNVPKGGRIYVFYSGHGAPDASSGASYLVPFDGDPKFLDSTALKLDALLARLGQSQAGEVVAMVDACFSGAGGRSILPPGARPLVRVNEPTKIARVAVFTAVSGAESSGPAEDSSAGLFSATVMDGLGNAKADVDGDGAITLGELSTWVAPRVRRAAKKGNRDQSPQLIWGDGLSASSDLVVVSGLRAQ